MNTDDTLNELIHFYGESSILPSRQQWQLLLNCEHEGPVCMVNFMKFREEANYPDGEKVSGGEAIARYHEISQKKVDQVGGVFIASGLFGGILIGEEEQWDAIGIVRYPNAQAFLTMFNDPEYREGHRHREAGTQSHRMAILLEF